MLTQDRDQKQTERSFGFKWQRRDAYDSPQMRAVARQWALQRDVLEMQRFFTQRRRILDAGCGSGFTASLWTAPAWRSGGEAQWLGCDISTAVDVAQERLGHDPGMLFVQADILQLPFREHAFDTIFSEGVLHHTTSTELALKLALKAPVTFLEPGGEILFYVYRKKGPLREFADDHIRNIVSTLDPEEAWAMLRPLTRLGQALAELHAEVEVPEDIPCLDIKAGRYDVQRLIYWHFAKLFWNQGLSLEENNLINFDWYHPRYAHRQTEQDLYRWCKEVGLTIFHFDVQESGFTVRATKG